MSETTVAAPVSPEPAAPAPVASPEAPQVAGTQGTPSTATPQTYASRREARASVGELVRERFKAAPDGAAAGETSATVGGPEATAQPAAATTPVIDATGRAHDPSSGQFTTPPAADAASGTEPPAATPQGDAAATPTAATTPQERRIPLPEGHSLREQGHEYIVALDDAHERQIRALLNSDTRRRDVEAAQQRAQAAETEALRLKAALEARDAWQDSAISEGVLQTYEALLETDKDVAEAYLAGKKQQMQTDADARYQQASDAVEGERVGQAAVQFLSSAYTELTSRLPVELVTLPAFAAAFDEARRRYGDSLDRREQMGQTVEPTVEGLSLYLQGALVESPEIVRFLSARQQQDTAQRQREAEANAEAERLRIQRDAEEKVRTERAAAEAEQLRAAATRQPNPLGAIPGGRADVASTTPGGVDLSRLPAHQLRSTLKQQARDEARQLARV